MFLSVVYLRYDRAAQVVQWVKKEKKKLNDYAKNNTAVASTGSNNKHGKNSAVFIAKHDITYSTVLQARFILLVWWLVYALQRRATYTMGQFSSHRMYM